MHGMQCNAYASAVYWFASKGLCPSRSLSFPLLPFLFSQSYFISSGAISASTCTSEYTLVVHVPTATTPNESINAELTCQCDEAVQHIPISITHLYTFNCSRRFNSIVWNSFFSFILCFRVEFKLSERNQSPI